MPLSGFSTIDICAAATATLPGAGTLEYAPLDEVDTQAYQHAILAAEYNQQADAGVTTWYALPYQQGSGSWSEDQDSNPQGDAYRLTVSAFLASDTAEVRAELNAMRHHRFLLRLTRSGLVLLIGTPEQPLRFRSAFESGAEAGDNRGHRITFTGNSLTKSPVYVPVF